MNAPSPQSANRDRTIAVIAIVVGALLTVSFIANALITINATEPATSDDIDRFVSCVQNVVFTEPATVAEVRQEILGAPRPAAANFCDRLAVAVSEAATTSTSTATTVPP